MKVCVRKGGSPISFENLVHKAKSKVYDYESFNNQDCFCHVNEEGIYLELKGLQLKEKSLAMRISCKKIEAGLVTIKDSRIEGISSTISLEQFNKDESIKFFKDMGYSEIFTIYIPFIKAKLKEEIVFQVIKLVIDSIQIVDRLIAFHHYLKNEMMIIQH